MKKRSETTVFEQAAKEFREIVARERLLGVDVSVLARPLTPEEAIGTPGRRDFPLITGKERLVEASVLELKGHAFTDSPREFMGTLEEVLALDVSANRNRAVYTAVLNAVLAHLGRARGTVHCRNEDPEKCADEIASHLLEKHGNIRVGLIGLNPAIAEKLAKTFGPENVRITDLNREQIGRERFGVEILDGGNSAGEMVNTSDVIVLTGTTLVNNTFDRIWEYIQKSKKPYYVYGVTCAGICALMGINRICPYGRDAEQGNS